MLIHVWLFCDPMDCGPPGSSVHGILQARTLEWVAIPFSRGSSWPRDQTHTSCIDRWFHTTEPPGKPELVFPWIVFPWISVLKSQPLVPQNVAICGAIEPFKRERSYNGRFQGSPTPVWLVSLSEDLWNQEAAVESRRETSEVNKLDFRFLASRTVRKLICVV